MNGTLSHPIALDPLLERESELFFERGGPVYRLMQRVGLIIGEGPSIVRRIVGVFLITWLPLLVLSCIDGRALGSSPRESFLLDFTTYARFFVAMPIMFYAEVTIGTQLTTAARQFVRAGFVKLEHASEYALAIQRIVRSRESVLAEVFIGILSLAGAILMPVEVMNGGPLNAWNTLTLSGGHRISLAGCWFHFIAIPILQFFYYRWCWRVFVWTRFLFTMSRLDLDVIPTHADQAGGLGFLTGAQRSLGFLFSGLSALISADIAFRIVFEGAKIESFRAPMFSLILAAEIFAFAPLLLFVPILERKNSEWNLKYSNMLLEANRVVHRNCTTEVASGVAAPNPVAMSSMSAFGASFKLIQEMNLFLFNSKSAFQLMVLVAIPYVVLVPLVMPYDDIIKFVTNLVF